MPWLYIAHKPNTWHMLVGKLEYLSLYHLQDFFVLYKRPKTNLFLFDDVLLISVKIQDVLIALVSVKSDYF